MGGKYKVTVIPKVFVSAVVYMLHKIDERMEKHWMTQTSFTHSGHGPREMK